MAARLPRALAVDWLRGIAALVMVQCHAMVLLRPGTRGPIATFVTSLLDGLVAPAFYFCAGFALAYTLVGAARAGSGAVARRAARVTFRIAQVLAVAAALTWQWFPILREPRWLLRIDVLSCIGLSLLALLPICALLARRPRLLGGVLLGLAAAIFALAPALGRIEGPLAPILGIRAGSVFPPVPWGAHLAVGAGVGALLASGVPALLLWAALACGATLAMGLGFLAAPLLGPHDMWSEPSGQLIRVAFVALAGFGLAKLEARAKPQPSPARRALEWYGTTSLWLYAFHEVWLYTSRFGLCFNDRWGGKLGWPAYTAATLGLIAATTATIALLELATRAWNLARRWATTRFRSPAL